LGWRTCEGLAVLVDMSEMEPLKAVSMMFDAIVERNRIRPESIMRTNITIDDIPYQRALELAGPDMDKADLFRVALQTFVRVQAGKPGSLGRHRAPHARHCAPPTGSCIAMMRPHCRTLRTFPF
jgi:Arc/MetJ family transcription regulator